jgi:uncharacterized membrane protein HdeD (DUF308 family)
MKAVTVSQNWWALAVRGLAAIFLGLIAFSWPGLTLALLAMFFSSYCLVDGVFSILSAIARVGKRSPNVKARPAVGIVVGLLTIAAGVITIRTPILTAIFFTYVVGFWALTRGIVELAAAFELPNENPGRVILGFSGFLSLVVGAFCAIWPLSGALALIGIVAAYTLIYGMTMMLLSFRLRDQNFEELEEAPRRAA